MSTPTSVVERDGQVRANRAPESNSRAFAVYVAAASADAMPRVTAVIAALRADGFVVTSTWPDVIASVGEANPRDASDGDRRNLSVGCLSEIDASHAVLFLVPTVPVATCGAWYEAGYAYSEHKHLVFSGDTKQSVFCALGIECASDEAALRHLRELRDRSHVDDGLRDLAANAPSSHATDCDAWSGESCSREPGCTPRSAE